jgi:hypothetical protein
MSVICYYSLWRYSCWEYCRNHPCIASGLFPGIQRRASMTSPCAQYRAGSLEEKKIHTRLNWIIRAFKPPLHQFRFSPQFQPPPPPSQWSERPSFLYRKIQLGTGPSDWPVMKARPE